MATNDAMSCGVDALSADASDEALLLLPIIQFARGERRVPEADGGAARALNADMAWARRRRAAERFLLAAAAVAVALTLLLLLLPRSEDARAVRAIRPG